jgi:cathepsin B
MLTRFLKVALVGITLIGSVVASIVAPQEIINTVNTHPTATWTAGVSKWSNLSIHEAKGLMGTVINDYDIIKNDFNSIKQNNDLECDVCQYAIGWIEKELEGNFTVSKIKEELDKVCSIVPSSYRSECDSIVDTYTPAIIDYLVSKEPPQKLCQYLTLCSSSFSVPDSFDGRQAFGKCVHPVRDQQQCGSCWAFSASEVLSDRFCINSKGSVDVVLSPQTLVSCDTSNMGCDGGYLNKAWQFLVSNGITSDSCEPYTSGGGDSGTCPTKCADNTALKYYKASSFTKVPSANIQTELMNGPVQVAFEVYQDFMSYKSGVYHHITGSLLGGHAVEMIGWGSDSGTPYWIVKNSWGTSWGEQGYFRILRGSNECGIESSVYTGIPAL